LYLNPTRRNNKDILKGAQSGSENDQEEEEKKQLTLILRRLKNDWNLVKSSLLKQIHKPTFINVT